MHLRSRAFCNLLFACLPATRCFHLKRLILNFFRVNVGEGTRVTGGLQIFGRGPITIGKNTWIGLNTHFYLSPSSAISIGDNCDIAPEVIFHNGTHAIAASGERRAGEGHGKDVRIGSGTWIGTRVTILAGCEVGDMCIVAAGALLMDCKYPSNSLIVGVPGRVVKTLP